MKSQKMASAKHVVKKQFVHALNKVVRPKVYITDTPSFKTLVQCLTGNQAVLPSFEQAVDHLLPVTAVECGSQPCSSVHSVAETEHTSSDADLNSLISEYMPTDHVVSPDYSDIESWLLNTDIPDYQISAAPMTELF